MVKVRVHMYEKGGNFMDENLYVDIELNFRPMIGEHIWLSDDQENELQLKLNDLIANERYGYKDMEILCRTRVKDIHIPQGKEFIQIEIG
mgnify:CR=1 FL=1